MIDINKLTSAICDMEDIKRSIPKDIKSLPKDHDGTEYTIGECIDDVLEYLKEIEKQKEYSNENRTMGRKSNETVFQNRLHRSRMVVVVMCVWRKIATIVR